MSRARDAEPSGAWRVIVAVAACTMLLASGCGRGDGIPRYRVSGTVSFNGSPVPAGMVYLNPDTTAGNDGPPGFAQIVAGRFDTAAKGGRHAIAGAHEVVIEGYEPPPADSTSEAGGRRLFGNFRVKLDVPKAASEHDFDVPAEAARRMTN